MQREEPVAVGGRTHGKRHQADVRFGGLCWPERQLCVGELTPDGDWAVSLVKRLLPCRANWQYRPFCDIRGPELDALQRTLKV